MEAPRGDARSYCIPFASTDAWRAHVATEGFVVITDVASAADCAKAELLFEQHFGLPAGKLYGDDKWPRGEHGMVVEGDIQRSDFVWFARTNPRVRDVYRTLYDGEDDLVCAFDRANAVRNLPNDNDLRPWLHIDYPVNDPPPFTCYQSFINYIDCTPADSPCLRVVPRSHTGEQWKSIVASIKASSSRDKTSAFFRVKLPEESVVNVLAPAGSLVVWICGLVHDARTTLTRSNPRYGKLRRLNAYICFAPRRCIRDEEEAAARRDAFEKGVTSTHWPVWFFSHHGYRGPSGDSRYNLAPYDVAKLLEAFPAIDKLI